MILVTYPISKFDEQMINHPNDSLMKMFDTSKKEDSVKALLTLLAHFGNSLRYFNLSNRSNSTFFDNVDNLFDDINSQEIDFENLWCVVLELEENDVRNILDGYKRDFVLVDRPTKTPISFDSVRKDSMIVYGDFELAVADKNDSDDLYCLLSIKNQDSKDECLVHIFQMKYENVAEIGTFKSSLKDDKVWFENSYDALCGLYSPSPKKKMYLAQYHFNDGNNFEGDIYNELFSSESDAMNALREEANNVERDFNREFGENEWEEEDRGDYICINYNYYEDYWEGKVIELEVQ